MPLRSASSQEVIVVDSSPPQLSRRSPSDVIVIDGPTTPPSHRHPTRQSTILLDETPPKRRRRDHSASLPPHPHPSHAVQTAATSVVVVDDNDDSTDDDASIRPHVPTPFTSAVHPTPHRSHVTLQNQPTSPPIMQDDVVEVTDLSVATPNFASNASATSPAEATPRRASMPRLRPPNAPNQRSLPFHRSSIRAPHSFRLPPSSLSIPTSPPSIPNPSFAPRALPSVAGISNLLPNRFTDSFTGIPLSPRARSSLRILRTLENHGNRHTSRGNRGVPLENSPASNPPALSPLPVSMPDFSSTSRPSVRLVRAPRDIVQSPYVAEHSGRRATTRSAGPSGLQNGVVQVTVAPGTATSNPPGSASSNPQPVLRRTPRLVHFTSTARAGHPRPTSRLHRTSSSTSSMASSSPGGLSAVPNARSPGHQQRATAQSLRAGVPGIRRRRSNTMAGRINTERLLGAHRYVRFHSAAGVPATIQLQIMHGLHGDRALDYDQLVRLDEELIREKNRAEKDQITSLPVQKATKEDQELRCCVCMCDVEEGEELRVLPCSHKYHKACIDEWLTYNGCCPVDKKRISAPRPRRKCSRHSQET